MGNSRGQSVVGLEEGHEGQRCLPRRGVLAPEPPGPGLRGRQGLHQELTRVQKAGLRRCPSSSSVQLYELSTLYGHLKPQD